MAAKILISSRLDNMQAPELTRNCFDFLSAIITKITWIWKSFNLSIIMIRVKYCDISRDMIIYWNYNILNLLRVVDFIIYRHKGNNAVKIVLSCWKIKVLVYYTMYSNSNQWYYVSVNDAVYIIYVGIIYPIRINFILNVLQIKIHVVLITVQNEGKMK